MQASMAGSATGRKRAGGMQNLRKSTNFRSIRTGIKDIDKPSPQRQQKTDSGNMFICIIASLLLADLFKQVVFGLSGFPSLAGKSLHIRNGIFFIHYFKAEQGFNDVFHGGNSIHSAIFVNNKGNVLFFDSNSSHKENRTMLSGK